MNTSAQILFLLLLISQVLSAQLSLSTFFNDNMVLQRDQPIRIWGTVSPNTLVNVNLGGQTASARSNAEGQWQVNLQARPAGGPHELTVNAANDRLTFSNIMFGEVWLCAGQSNMERPLKVADGGLDAARTANFPNIRYFKVRRRMATTPQTTLSEGNWTICTPTTAEDYSGTAFYFVRDLHQSLNVPVGIIDISWGGTSIDAWISPGGLSGFPELVTALDMLPDQTIAEIEADIAQQKAERGALLESTDIGLQQQWQSDNSSSIDWPSMELRPQPLSLNPNDMPASIYNGMVHPFTNLQIKGVAWYQGESDTGSPYWYRNKQVKLIDDWRENWEIGEFAFIVTQLPNFRQTVSEPGSSSWANLRESQTFALKRNQTALTAIIDAGEANDIHPGDKKTVGERLALTARRLCYGDNVVASGPRFFTAEINNSEISINFRMQNNSTLRHINGGTQLRGFAIAGEDGEFVWANARISSSSSVRVWHSSVPNPKYVRYAWSDNPGELDLYNNANLPAMPFRTDQLLTPWE